MSDVRRDRFVQGTAVRSHALACGLSGVLRRAVPALSMVLILCACDQLPETLRQMVGGKPPVQEEPRPLRPAAVVDAGRGSTPTPGLGADAGATEDAGPTAPVRLSADQARELLHPLRVVADCRRLVSCPLVSMWIEYQLSVAQHGTTGGHRIAVPDAKQVGIETCQRGLAETDQGLLPAPLRTAVHSYAEKLAALNRPLTELSTYYVSLAYMDDSSARATQLHDQIVAPFAAFATSDAALSTVLADTWRHLWQVLPELRGARGPLVRDMATMATRAADLRDAAARRSAQEVADGLASYALAIDRATTSMRRDRAEVEKYGPLGQAQDVIRAARHFQKAAQLLGRKLPRQATAASPTSAHDAAADEQTTDLWRAQHAADTAYEELLHNFAQLFY